MLTDPIPIHDFILTEQAAPGLLNRIIGIDEVDEPDCSDPDRCQHCNEITDPGELQDNGGWLCNFCCGRRP